MEGGENESIGRGTVCKHLLSLRWSLNEFQDRRSCTLEAVQEIELIVWLLDVDQRLMSHHVAVHKRFCLSMQSVIQTYTSHVTGQQWND